MPEIVKCPTCDRALRVPDELLGQQVKCSNCQSVFTAALPQDEPAAPPPDRVRDEPPPPPQDPVQDQPAAPRRPRRRSEDADRNRGGRDDDDDYPVERRRSSRRTEEARAAVAGPAIALMIVGGLALGLSLLGLCVNIIGAAGAGGRGRGGADPMANAIGGIVGGVVGMCWGGVVLSGALQMKNLRSFGYAMTACIVAMLPCNACCLLGLPFGIWGLTVLNQPHVKDSFG